MFASDLQGPASAVAAAYLIQQRPTLLYLSGPVSYLERDVGRDAIERAIDQLSRVIEATGCRVIMDHHALRDAGTPSASRGCGRPSGSSLPPRFSASTSRARGPTGAAWAAVRKPPGTGRGFAC